MLVWNSLPLGKNIQNLGETLWGMNVIEMVNDVSYIAYWSPYHHVVCNVPVSRKANREGNQLGVWRYSHPKDD